MPDHAALPIGLLLAGFLGFSAHRSGVCTVKAVAEIVTTRHAHMLAGFVRTALWVILVTDLLTVVFGASPASGTAWSLSVGVLAGGFVFGIGAAVNSACVFSTLTGLADGRVGFLLTILGLTAGIFAPAILPPLPAPVSEALPVGARGFATGLPLLLALLAWAIWEAWRLWRDRPRGMSLRAAMSVRVYRLSTAALVIGVCNGVLFYLFGNWMFTHAIEQTARAAAASSGTLSPVAWLLFAALFLGMLFSAVQRRSFRLRLPGLVDAARSLMGGFLMGVGAAMIPGGNATLLLHYIPAFSPHAVPAYLALLPGIGAAFLLAGRLGMSLPRVSCAGDVCQPENVGAEGQAVPGRP